MNYENRLTEFIQFATASDIRVFRKALKVLIRARMDRYSATETLVNNWQNNREYTRNLKSQPIVAVNSKY
jgi:hypothetical protein